jgi:glycosyltransferase involved in cell wall biosynthesis
MGRFAGYSLPNDIVMISTADWDAPLWTNKQQIASRLVEDFRVVYVEPLVALGKGPRGYTHRSWDADCGVHVYRPAGALPFGQKFDQINEVNHRLASSSLRNHIDRMGIEEYILWIYTPNGAPYLTTMSPKLSCYDCVDEYSAFPGAWRSRTIKMENKLAQGVDVVFTTAEALYEAKKKKNPNTHYVPNVADFEHFHQTLATAPAKPIRDMTKPVIGFVGALNYKLNQELLTELFELRPDWNFVFIGPDRGFGIEKYARVPNATFFGRKPIAELPAFMAGMDVCIIPYKVDRYTRGVLPIKFFEYLASGRPVVSTPIPELSRFSDLVDVASTAEQFIGAIERRLKNDPQQQRDWRIDLARANSWETRIGEILKQLERTYRKKRLNK